MRKTKRAMGNELNSEVGMRNAENKKRRKAQGKKITTEGHGTTQKRIIPIKTGIKGFCNSVYSVKFRGEKSRKL